MKKLKAIIKRLNEWKLFILVVVAVAGTFYWYQVRPSEIYSKCGNSAKEKTVEALEKGPVAQFKDFYDLVYLACLRSEGINK